MNDLTPHERLRIAPQEMPTQNPLTRVTNMEEVALGYTPEQARNEALRCLQCKNAPCVNGCPVRINIPKFIHEICHNDLSGAIATIKEASVLPAICGRVCPQEEQCQASCTVGKALKDINKAVSIGRLERFVADWDRENKKMQPPVIHISTGKKVAVIGSGPASITVAADVRRAGHDVTMFEAFHKAGGVLVYGIPEFRLPKRIVEDELNILTKMGIQLITDFVVGRTVALHDLLEKEKFDAVFIGTGAGLPKFLNIEGENLVGVFSANEYLTRSNLMKAFNKAFAHTPIYPARTIGVLGGGNVAMDAARTALRLGTKEVHLIYRRTEKEMPARIEEVAHAKEEGVIFHFLTNIKRFLPGHDGRLSAVECLRYELGAPDASGRQRPMEIKHSEFRMDLDAAIVAIGNESNPLIKQTTPDLLTDRQGHILTDDNGQTSIKNVFAGGDIVLGSATVILAMGQGRKAAQAINAILKG